MDFDTSVASTVGAPTLVGGVLAPAVEHAALDVDAAPSEGSSLLPDDEPAWTTVPAPAPDPLASPVPMASPDPVGEPSTDPVPVASSDVVIVKKRTLRRLAGLLGGALVGAMLAGAVVIPFLSQLIQVGAAAGVAVIAVSAWIGMRIALSSDKA